MTGPLQKGHAMAALVLGAIELLCAILVIILSIVLANKTNLPASFSPWWAGAVFAIPGILGIVVGITKNYCCMIAFMVLNIITFIIQGVGAVFLAIAMVIIMGYVNCDYDYTKGVCVCRNPNGGTASYNMDSCDVLDSVTSMAVAIVVFLAIAGCISFAAAIVGCCGTCCNSGNQGGAVIYNNPQ